MFGLIFKTNIKNCFYYADIEIYVYYHESL